MMEEESDREDLSVDWREWLQQQRTNEEDLVKMSVILLDLYRIRKILILIKNKNGTSEER